MENLILFNKLIESRRKINDIFLAQKEMEKDINKEIQRNFILNTLKTIYTYQIDDIKPLNFPLINPSISYCNEDCYMIRNPHMRVEYGEKIIRFDTMYGDNTFKYKIDSDSYVFLNHERTASFEFSSDEKVNKESQDENKMIKSVEKLINDLDKTQAFYHDSINFLKGDDISYFVKKYKDYKELICVFFLCANENDAKIKVFDEMKKEGKEITLKDIRILINIIQYYSQNKVYKKENDLDINSDLTLDKCKEKLFTDMLNNYVPINKNSFDFIMTILSYHNLKEKLDVEKNNIKVSYKKKI